MNPLIPAAVLIAVSLPSAPPPPPSPEPPKPPAKAEPSGKAEPPAKSDPVKAEPVLAPGKAVVPTKTMRRIWGELISLDPATRTGKFRNEGNDEVMAFTVMPHAELLHHAAFGDLRDFRVGERAIFRLHPDPEGRWTLLTYIQDELNFLNGHKEYYHVEAVDPAAGEIRYTQGSADGSYVREKGLTVRVDNDTRFWKAGKCEATGPAGLSGLKAGDRFRTKTRGGGKGRSRIAWEVFLDDEGILKWQAEQKAVHLKRLAEEGLAGYVESAEGRTVRLTLFQEAREAAATLKPGDAVRIAPAGGVPGDRKPTSEPIAATLTEIKAAGPLHSAVVTLPEGAALPAGLSAPNVARLWAVKPRFGEAAK
jgi:hypothetical protein